VDREGRDLTESTARRDARLASTARAAAKLWERKQQDR
jgi:hypothetical protein